ncbi:hypothetical protein C1H46_032749 [Malus baccata]|uniref:Uncharacterized protein n=1 Tax=Malus baccata TaxID=106549 RepID=A0A540L5D1_MALBA|nr:hypothetical protein C1H46_032749 [Malus baccata]
MNWKKTELMMLRIQRVIKHSSLEGYDNCSDHVDDDNGGESESDDHFDSAGYNEDDDQNGGKGEIGWGDMDEYDYNLEKRIELH